MVIYTTFSEIHADLFKKYVVYISMFKFCNNTIFLIFVFQLGMKWNNPFIKMYNWIYIFVLVSIHKRLRKGKIDGFTTNAGDLCPNDVLIWLWLWWCTLIWLLDLVKVAFWLLVLEGFGLFEMGCLTARFEWDSFAIFLPPPTFAMSTAIM